MPILKKLLVWSGGTVVLLLLLGVGALVVIGSGLPLLPPPTQGATLRLTKHRVYEKTGTTTLAYAVV